MADLKRNVIELVQEVKEGEIITKKYVTPVFIPLSVVYQAIDLNVEMEKTTRENEREMIDKLLDFVANEVYKDQFTKDELINGLHAPQALEILQQQILFIARGHQTNETKKYFAKKN